jgi:hypothetical protein
MLTGTDYPNSFFFIPVVFLLWKNHRYLVRKICCIQATKEATKKAPRQAVYRRAGAVVSGVTMGKSYNVRPPSYKLV